MEKNNHKKVDQYHSKIGELMVGSLIALCFIMLPAIISLDTRKTALQVAIYAFAIAIPALISFFLYREAHRLSINYKPVPSMGIAIGASGSLAALIGLGSVFWYVSQWAASLFCFALIVSASAFIRYENAILREFRTKKPIKD